MFNWVDLIIIIAFIIYVWDGFHRGFLRLAWELVGILIAFVFALKFYPNLNHLFLNNFHLSEIYSKPIAFLSIWFLVQLIFYFIGRLLAFYTPFEFKVSKVNQWSGVIPAALKGIILIAVLLILFVIVPISSTIKYSIDGSLIGGYLIRKMAIIENQVEIVFSGNTASNSLISTQTQEENISLGFTTTQTKIDEQAENQMFDMLNLEREKAGVSPVGKDILIRNVARAQARDMLLKGYFAHTSPAGVTYLDRLNAAHVNFTAAAENIALAPTISLADIGLFNSPKHKENILDPTYTHIGIGVIDAGPYGLMIVEDFVR